MTRYIKIMLMLCLPVLIWAGNPDRQGEAGAYELLLTPWAKAAGFNLINTSSISGIEAMRLNPAGIHFNGKNQFAVGHMRLFEGSGVSMNAAGLGFKLGKNGTVAVSMSAMDFGDIKVTTENQPEGTGGTYSPSFIHLGVGYSHSFEDKIFVGVLVRGISQTVIDVTATGVALDAGVQYRGGVDDRVRLGISLRNVGPSMQFSGEGLSNEIDLTQAQTNQYFLTGYVRTAKFELPTVLNLGVSYDFLFAGGRDYLRTIFNFTSNAFARDNIGAGFEYSYKKTFQVRAAYKYAIDAVPEGNVDIYSGLSAGFSIDVKAGKKTENRIAVDYAYRTTLHYAGTHNIGLRFAIN